MTRKFHFKAGRILLLAIFGIVAGVMLYPTAAFAGGTVGNGTAASCTETALNTALSGGGNIKFNCGAANKTITLTGTKTIAVTTKLDGGSKIVLSAPGHSHFLVNSSVTFTLQNITLKNGSGTNAGALENYGTTNLDTVKFINNTASAHGGAITNHGTVRGGFIQFKENKAGVAGGAVYNDGGVAQFELVTFKANQATRLGGAIDNNAGGVLVLFSTFSNNQASDGGAVYNTGDGSTNQEFIAGLTTFTNNHGGYGGAIENNGALSIGASTFTKNSVTGDGGAIWVLNGNLDLTDVTIDQNSAGTTGGGISIYSGATGDIEKVSFTNNHSDQEGGGFFNAGDTKLYNSTFSGNSSTTTGGGVYQSYGTLTAYNNTLGDNTAPTGGGFEVTGGTLDLQDNVLAHNHGSDCGGTVPSNGANVSSDNSCTAFTKPRDKKNTNAFLSPPGNNGGFGQTYLPEVASPLIDAGTTLSDIGEDEREVSRPVGSDPDIGAIEVCRSKPDAPNLSEPGNGGTEPLSAFEFIWFRPTECGAFFQLTVRSGSKKGPVVIQQSYVPVTGYLQPKALALGTYYWQVKACDEIGCTASAWWNFKVSKKGAPLDILNLPQTAARWSKLLGHQ